jgi:hypothetical protein
MRSSERAPRASTQRGFRRRARGSKGAVRLARRDDEHVARVYLEAPALLVHCVQALKIEAPIVYDINPLAVAPESAKVARGQGRESLFTVVLGLQRPRRGLAFFFAARGALAGCGRFGVAGLVLAGFAFAEAVRFGVAGLVLAGFAFAVAVGFGVAGLVLAGFAFAEAVRFGVAGLVLAGFAFASVGSFGAAALVLRGFAATAGADRFGWAGSGRGRTPSGAARSGTGSGTRVPPAASSATSSAIFFARPEGVLTPLLRAASSRMFGWLRRLKVSSARRSDSIAARRSPGMMASEALRRGAVPASRRPSATA